MTTDIQPAARLAAVPRAVIMQPTTLCQPLDCTYCYLPFRKQKHLMPQAVASAVSGWAEQDQRFEVVWHGGEPLSAGRDHLGKLMAPFTGVKHTLQTNAALLDDAWCDFLLEHDVGVEEGANTTEKAPDPARATEFWAALTAAWEANPVIQLREISRVLDFASRVLGGERASGPAARPWDPLPTIAYDGRVVLLSPELAGFTDDRFGDFTTGNVLHHELDQLLSEAADRTPWLAEFWQGVDSCRATCPTFAFCGGGHPANRYFEHHGRLDGTRTAYCTTAKIALLEGVTRHVRTHRD